MAPRSSPFQNMFVFSLPEYPIEIFIEQTIQKNYEIINNLYVLYVCIQACVSVHALMHVGRYVRYQVYCNYLISS